MSTDDSTLAEIDRIRRLRSFRWFFVLAAAFITFVLTQSIYSPPPVKPADVVIFVTRPAPNVALLTEVRSVLGTRAGESVYMSRKLYQEGRPSNFIVLEGGNFTTLKGGFPMMHTVTLPAWVQGRWCSATRYTWWPSWSQREFSLEADDVCFETTEYE